MVVIPQDKVIDEDVIPLDILVDPNNHKDSMQEEDEYAFYVEVVLTQDNMNAEHAFIQRLRDQALGKFL